METVGIHSCRFLIQRAYIVTSKMCLQRAALLTAGRTLDKSQSPLSGLFSPFAQNDLFRSIVAVEYLSIQGVLLMGGPEHVWVHIPSDLPMALVSR